ncbi:MAG TPA: hypothetical protein VFE42_11210 [Chloroflexota bacterium]|nr:hypothetical protein [Chloroflexota bacterium]
MISTGPEQSSQGLLLAEVFEDIRVALDPPAEWKIQAVIAQGQRVWVRAVHLPMQEVLTIVATRR